MHVMHAIRAADTGRPASRRSTRLAVAALALGATTLVAACGDESDASDGELEIDTVDFAYEGLPESVDTGTHLRIHNSSTTEVHEAVVFRVADDDVDTPLPELLAAAETDPMALGEFVAVSVALPGENGVEPDGPVVLDTPGRYVIACFVPTEADPDLYRAALETGTPPDAGDGVPHVAHGMVAEITVE